MRRICTFSARCFMQLMSPQPRSCRRPLRRRSPHRSGADSGRRAAPDRRTRRRSSAPRRDEARPPPAAPTFATSCVPGHAAASRCRRPLVAHCHAHRRGIDRRKFPGAGKKLDRLWSRCAPDAETPRRDAHRAPTTARRTCAKALRAARIATTGIAAPSARPFTALSPTRTPVKLPGPVDGDDSAQLSEFDRRLLAADRPPPRPASPSRSRPASSICPRISRSRPASRPEPPSRRAAGIDREQSADHQA